MTRLRSRLEDARRVVECGVAEAVSIDALPTRLFSLLSRAQVSLASRSGARIPVEHQGEGTQSLAVLLLFGAFLRSKLSDTAREYPEQGLAPDIGRARLTTFHGFATDVLRQYGSHLGLRPDFTILNQDPDRHVVLRRALECATDAGVPAGLTPEGVLPLVDRLLRNGQYGREVRDQPLPFTVPGREWIRLVYLMRFLHTALRLAERPASAEQLALLCAAYRDLTAALVRPVDAMAESTVEGTPCSPGSCRRRL